MLARALGGRCDFLHTMALPTGDKGARLLPLLKAMCTEPGEAAALAASYATKGIGAAGAHGDGGRDGDLQGAGLGVGAADLQGGGGAGGGGADDDAATDAAFKRYYREQMTECFGEQLTAMRDDHDFAGNARALRALVDAITAGAEGFSSAEQRLLMARR